MKKIQFVLLYLFFIPSSIFSQQTYWWNETVFYEVFVRSYFDSNADGIGDFKGLLQKLDYLNDGDPSTTSDLGIQALWLMPIMQSPSYHGYDVTNYKAVQSQYGSSNDFKQLVQAAHQRGIKVVVDFVINHSSDQHPWFQKSANKDPLYRNFYRWSQTKPSYSGPWGQQVWHAKNNEYYYGLFWSGMPDLNYECSPMVDSIYSAADFWLDSMQIDGFRLDAAMYLYENGATLQNLPQTISFWKNFNTHCKTKQSNMMTVGEVWSDANTISLYNQKLDYCFEFNIASDIVSSINNANPNQLKTSIKYAYENYPLLQYGLFLTNHDQNRVLESLNNSIEKNKLAASLYLSLPGIPYVYYGEEIGMIGSKPDESIRRPMQWTAGTNAGFSAGTPWYGINSNYKTFNVLNEKKDSNSLWSFYNKAIQARNKETALQKGTYKNLANNKASVYAYLRQFNSENILVIHNLSPNPTDSVLISLLGTGLASGAYTGTNLLTGKNNVYEIINLSSIQLEPLAAYETKWIKLNQANSLSDLSQWNELKVYPVPSSQYFTIESKFINANAQIELFDQTGKKILLENNQKAIEPEKIWLNLGDLPTGIYNLTIENLNLTKSVRLLKVN
jgi:glycosidase